MANPKLIIKRDDEGRISGSEFQGARRKVQGVPANSYLRSTIIDNLILLYVGQAFVAIMLNKVMHTPTLTTGPEGC